MIKKNFFLRIRIKNTLYILVVIGLVLGFLDISLNMFIKASAKRDTYLFMREVFKNNGKNFMEMDQRRHESPRGESRRNWGGHEDILNLLRKDYYGRSYSFLFNPGIWSHYYFTAILDESFEIRDVIHDPQINENIGWSNDFYREVISYSRAHKKVRGFYKDVAFLVTDYNDGSMVVIVDQINEIAIKKRFLKFSSVTIGLCMIIFCIVSWSISKIVVGTVEKVFLQKKRFVADASHELKTPIAVVSANISVLEQEFPNNKWLGYIKTENDRMGQIVKDLLYLANDDSGVVKYEKTVFDLGNAAACSVLPFECVAFEENKKLELEIPEGTINVFGNETRIRQVVAILTDNAMKNTDKGDMIKISVGTEGSKAYVRVYNTGHGINPKERKEIFNRFYRSDVSRNRATGGYGLGLSIAKAIANGHDGSIEVDSVVGKYAQFTFFIPLNHPKKHQKA